jgi:hypothetical protein
MSDMLQLVVSDPKIRLQQTTDPLEDFVRLVRRAIDKLKHIGHLLPRFQRCQLVAKLR